MIYFFFNKYKFIIWRMLMPVCIVQDQGNRHMHSNNVTNESLKSSISMWFERWFLSTNAKDIGTCATRALTCVLFVIWYTNSDITGVLLNFGNTYLPYDTDMIIANNLIIVIAGIKWRVGNSLSYSDNSLKGFWHGYDEKLDTHRSAWVSLTS